MSPRHPRSISGFLAAASKALMAPKGQRSTPLTLVVGNEAEDLDSFCSAFLFSYLRSHTPPHYTLHIPLANIPRQDLALRRDFDAVFSTAEVTRSEFPSLSDIPDDLEPKDTRWLLVDHNELTGSLASKFSGRVVGCIDHHHDEGKVPHDTGDEPRVIRPCGSCTSLVVQYCRETWDSITAEEKDSGSLLPSQLAHIALGPILADTTALRSRSKTTDQDVEIARLAEALVVSPPLGATNDAAAAGMGEGEYDRIKYFDELCRLKEDISGFSYRDLLRKDYKEWTTQNGSSSFRLGMSSVPQPFGRIFETVGAPAELIRETRRWAVERGLDLVSIMTVEHHDGQLQRELLVWAVNERAVAAAKRFLERFEDELQLEGWDDKGTLHDTESHGEWMMAWRQGNSDHSRKQVAPMLREAMKEASKL